MSSYLSKSKKSFQPKAPARRQAAPSQNACSLRDSQDYQQSPESKPRSRARGQPPISDSVKKAARTQNAHIHRNNSSVFTDLDLAAQEDSGRIVGLEIAGSNNLHHAQAPSLSSAGVELARHDSAREQSTLSAREGSSAASEDIDVSQAGEPPRKGHQHVEKHAGPVSISVRGGLPTPKSTQPNRDAHSSPNSLLQSAPTQDINTPPNSGRMVSQEAKGETRLAKQGASDHIDNSDFSGRDDSVGDTGERPLGPLEATWKEGENFVGSKGAKAIRKGNPVQPVLPPKRKARVAKNASKKGRAQQLPKESAAKANQTAQECETPPSQRKRKLSSENSSQLQEKKVARPRRAKTPENAEEQRIDESLLTMDALMKLKTGRLGDREKRLREVDAEKMAEKQAAAHAELGELMDTPDFLAHTKRREAEQQRQEEDKSRAQRIFDEEQGWSHKPSGRYGARMPRSQESETATADMANVNGEDGLDEASEGGLANTQMFRTVDGQIVMGSGSAPPHNSNIVLVEKNEDELSRRINQASFKYREPRSRWTPELTLKFYDGLRTFGTDFGMIATLFPGMSRQQIKRKFVKEEKLDSKLVSDVLLGTRKTITIAEIEEISGHSLVDPVAWQAETDAREERIRQEKRQDRQDEEERNRNRGKSLDAIFTSEGDEHEDNNEQRDGNLSRGVHLRDRQDEIIEGAVEGVEMLGSTTQSIEVDENPSNSSLAEELGLRNEASRTRVNSYGRRSQRAQGRNRGVAAPVVNSGAP